MKETLIKYLPWALSAINIWMVVLQGKMHKSAWLWGLLNQLVWLVWIVLTESWGLMPLNIALWYLYAKNYFQWKKVSVL